MAEGDPLEYHGLITSGSLSDDTDSNSSLNVRGGKATNAEIIVSGFMVNCGLGESDSEMVEITSTCNGN